MTQNVLDQFFQDFPESTQEILRNLRSIVHTHCPNCTEKIGYGIPTFVYLKTNLIHFSAYKHHIGLYPGSEAIEIFKDEIKGYKTAKGSIQIPLDIEFPYDLFTKILIHRVEQVELEKKLKA